MSSSSGKILELDSQGRPPKRHERRISGSVTLSTARRFAGEGLHYLHEAQSIRIKPRVSHPVRLPPTTGEPQITQASAQVVLKIDLVRGTPVAGHHAAQLTDCGVELVATHVLEDRVRPGKID